jgi:pSer/pThr/pTyr-binding forkhead associated (FHA) protein
VTDDSLVVGRAADCDLVVLNDDTVSRKHLRLSIKDMEGITLEDLGSKVGTKVGGRGVDKALLTGETVISLGTHAHINFCGPSQRQVEIPSLLSIGRQQLEIHRESLVRVQAGFRAIEIALMLTNGLILSWAADSGLENVRAKSLALKLGRPLSMGDWVATLRELGPSCPTVLQPMVQPFFNQKGKPAVSFQRLEGLISARNKLAHGTPQVGGEVSDLEETQRVILDHLSYGFEKIEVECFSPVHFEFEPESEQIQAVVHRLMGTSSLFPIANLNIPEGFLCLAPWMYAQVLGRMLSLEPFFYLDRSGDQLEIIASSNVHIVKGEVIRGRGILTNRETKATLSSNASRLESVLGTAGKA